MKLCQETFGLDIGKKVLHPEYGCALEQIPKEVVTTPSLRE